MSSSKKVKFILLLSTLFLTHLTRVANVFQNLIRVDYTISFCNLLIVHIKILERKAIVWKSFELNRQIPQAFYTIMDNSCMETSLENEDAMKVSKIYFNYLRLKLKFNVKFDKPFAL